MCLLGATSCFVCYLRYDTCLASCNHEFAFLVSSLLCVSEDLQIRPVSWQTAERTSFATGAYSRRLAHLPGSLEGA